MKRLLQPIALFALLLILTIVPALSQTPSDSSEQRPNTTTTTNTTGFDETDFNRTFKHHMANVNGVQLHYVMGGKGDPVVLVHGFPTTWYAWRKVMPALAKRYTVIAPDMRGMGDSEKPASGYDGRNVAEDIYQLVRSLGFQRIFLVGHDMGVIPSYAYAAAHPTDVRRLVVLELPVPGFGLEELVREQNVWHFGFHQAPDNLAEQLVAGRERTYLSWFIQRDVFNKAAITDADLDVYARAYSAPGAMSGGFAHYRALPETIKQNQESGVREKLPMPVLALGGEYLQKDIPLKSLQRAAVNVRGGVVKQCGHYIAEEQPEELLRQLLTFFGEEQ